MIHRRRHPFHSHATARGLCEATTLVLVGWTFVVGAALADSHAEGERPGDRTGIEARDDDAGKREAAQAGTADPVELVPFVPPSRGKAKRSAAGGTRGRTEKVNVAVVAPAEGLTTREAPMLYWYLSARTTARIDFVLADDDAIDPVLEFTIPTPVEAGIHAIDLARRGAVLEPGRVYRWSIAVVHDAERRSNDTMAMGVIERTGTSPSLERSLAEAPRRFAPYALSGIWYDALAELRSALAEDPANRGLRRQEVALLEQIELPEVARYARTETR